MEGHAVQGQDEGSGLRMHAHHRSRTHARAHTTVITTAINTTTPPTTIERWKKFMASARFTWAHLTMLERATINSRR